MTNPVLVEVMRGERVESVHRGALAVVDDAGSLVLGLGDIDRPVFPRSAIKAFQALPLLEEGAADRVGLTPAEIALACASHGGEPEHVATAAAMLAKAGLDDSHLACGSHWPLHAEAAQALARSGALPRQLHNNCSGKHAGFLCLACASGEEPGGYVLPSHPVQRRVQAAIEAMTATRLSDDLRGIDGCSIPTFALALRALALGFARLGSGRGLGPQRAQAARRICAAAAAHPFMVAGTGRFDTQVMTLLGSRAFVKTGAEGMHCAALPEFGLGIALKCDDGATRAADALMAGLLLNLLALQPDEHALLAGLAAPRLLNWRGLDVGSLRLAPNARLAATPRPIQGPM
jgi:L-asparaginase II